LATATQTTAQQAPAAPQQTAQSAAPIALQTPQTPQQTQLDAAQRFTRALAERSGGVKSAPAQTDKTAPVGDQAAAKTAVPRTAQHPAAPVVVETAPPLDAPETAPQSQNVSATTSAGTHANSHVQHAANDHAARMAPAAQVAREIIRRFDGGSTKFELRLDPPELGRIEVRMEVSRDHRVTAVIAADSPQALAELARHARDLEQQLQAAGLELSDNGLSFDLRQGGHGGETEDANMHRGPSGGGAEANLEPEAPVARPLGLERWRGVRVDMMV
jgi:flagellar hook-length control protein FliK